MKTLQKISSNFFTENTAKFIFDVGIEDSIIPFAKVLTVHKTEAFQFNSCALKKFPEIAKEIENVLNEATGRGIPALGGMCSESVTFDLNKIRQHKFGVKIEDTLHKLEIAVKKENPKTSL